jgi:hypothetical protein
VYENILAHGPKYSTRQNLVDVVNYRVGDSVVDATPHWQWADRVAKLTLSQLRERADFRREV